MPRRPRRTPDQSPARPTPAGGRPIERQAPAGSWAATLSAIREEAGIDRAEMARRLGVKPPQVTRWESGDVEIGESVSRRYANALRRPITLTVRPEES